MDLEGRVCHGREHVLALQDVYIPYSQSQGERHLGTEALEDPPVRASAGPTGVGVQCHSPRTEGDSRRLITQEGQSSSWEGRGGHASWPHPCPLSEPDPQRMTMSCPGPWGSAHFGSHTGDARHPRDLGRGQPLGCAATSLCLGGSMDLLPLTVGLWPLPGSQDGSWWDLSPPCWL